MIMTMMIYGDDDENGGLLHLPMKRIVKQFGECFCVCLLGGGVGHILMTMMKYILQYTIMYNSMMMMIGTVCTVHNFDEDDDVVTFTTNSVTL